MLYGALDNDDMFMYVGGLAAAIRSIDGKSPEVVVTNTRDPGKPEMTSIDKFIGTEFRSRYVNPTWIEGMKKEGYAGAGAMREFVEYLWGWNATVPETVDAAMWKETFDVYVEDKHHLDMKDFFEQKSPYAYQDMAGRMVETVRKGYWDADPATKKKLLAEYIDSVNQHGASGAEVTTGNARLSKYVIDQAKAAGIPVPAIEGFQRAMERAMGGTVAATARATETFVRQNEATSTATPEGQLSEVAGTAANALAPGRTTAHSRLQGYLMEEKKSSSRGSRLRPSAPWDTSGWAGAGVMMPVLACLVAWRWRQKRSLATPSDAPPAA